MLTKLLENGKKKADIYYPVALNTPMIFGEVTVTLTDASSTKFFEIRKFTLTVNSENRTLTHLVYNEWPDFGVPSTTIGIRELAKKVSIERERARNLGLDGAIIVHCSAGVGRSGAFIAIHYMMERLLRSQPINVADIVHEIRSHRAGMVQTLDQYKLIYKTLEEFEDLIHPESRISHTSILNNSLNESELAKHWLNVNGSNRATKCRKLGQSLDLHRSPILGLHGIIISE